MQTRMDAESFIQSESEARLTEIQSTKSQGKRVVNRIIKSEPGIRITDQNRQGLGRIRIGIKRLSCTISQKTGLQIIVTE